jgi:hypothetical protein
LALQSNLHTLQSRTGVSVTFDLALHFCSASLGTDGSLDTVCHQEASSGIGSNGLVGEGIGKSVKKGSTLKGGSHDLRWVEYLEGEKQEGLRAKNNGTRGGDAGN